MWGRVNRPLLTARCASQTLSNAIVHLPNTHLPNNDNRTTPMAQFKHSLKVPTLVKVDNNHNPALSLLLDFDKFLPDRSQAFVQEDVVTYLSFPLTRCFRIYKQIGQGGFGSVFSVSLPPDHSHQTALKTVGVDPNNLGDVLNEVRCLVELSPHDNIVTLHAAWLESTEEWSLLCSNHLETSCHSSDWSSEGEESVSEPLPLTLFLHQELCDMSLADWLQQRQVVVAETWRIFGDIVAGVVRCHEKGWIHGDISPKNILLASDGACVKLADFGLARRVGQLLASDPSCGAQGAVLYTPPEVVSGQVSQATTAADVFSLGVLLLELLLPFQTMMERGVVLGQVKKGVIPLASDDFDEQSRELVVDMTNLDPTQRPTIQDVAVRVGQLAT